MDARRSTYHVVLAANHELRAVSVVPKLLALDVFIQGAPLHRAALLDAAGSCHRVRGLLIHNFLLLHIHRDARAELAVQVHHLGNGVIWNQLLRRLGRQAGGRSGQAVEG